MVFEMFLLMTLLILSIVNADSPIEVSINNHRNQPFCEFVQAQLTSAILWSSLTQHDCPQPQWNDIKSQYFEPQYFVVDTRYITRDTTIIHFESSQLISDSFFDIQEFVGANPTYILPFLRESELRGTPSVPLEFESFELAGFDVTYIWNAGEQIFVLIETVGSIENYYILSSSTFLDSLVPPVPGIDYEIGLPNNWRLQSMQIESDIINRGANGISDTPILIRDHFGNNFQLLTPLSCISCNDDMPCYCDEDSDDDDSSEHAAAALFEENTQLGDNDGATTRVINLHFSNETLVNIWILFGVLMSVNIIFGFYNICNRKKRGVAKVVEESSTMDNVHI